MDRSFWRRRRVLVTGHTGFKGAWLTAWLEALGADVTGIALPSAPTDLYALIGLSDHRSILADLRHVELTGIVEDAAPEVVFHLAAQSTVQNGYRDPEATFSTNVMGTLRLLDALRDIPSLRCAVVVTTDKVYGNEPRNFQESDRLVASDPYAGSKVAQEIVVDSFRYSFFEAATPLVCARAGNVIGGGDDAPDRLLPDCVRATRAGEQVRLRHPEAVRPWQHVLEPLRGYLMYAEAAADSHQVPPALNFGPNPSDSATVGEVASEFLEQLTGEPAHIVVGDPDPLMAENPCLTIDASAAAPSVGWKPVIDRATAISWTAEWYAAAIAGRDVRCLTFEQIAAYEELAR
jgi:CDP-glucose 4,6-dehydratase